MNDTYYDTIGRAYRSSKELPFRKHIESYSLFQIAGDIGGFRVLDLGCGEGFYTRKFKLAGAGMVIGVDTSHAMIDLAKTLEDKSPIGCLYIPHDIVGLPYLESFDLVVAMYLLGCARSKDELLDFCKAAYNQVRSGGRFIGFNDNMSNNIGKYGKYRQYGFTRESKHNRKEGDRIRYVFHNQDGSTFQTIYYYLHPETYEDAFREAGFADFEWIDPMMDTSQQNESSWNYFMDNPPIIGFQAKKK